MIDYSSPKLLNELVIWKKAAHGMEKKATDFTENNKIWQLTVQKLQGSMNASSLFFCYIMAFSGIPASCIHHCNNIFVGNANSCNQNLKYTTCTGTSLKFTNNLLKFSQQLSLKCFSELQ
jgi:hypothetical protein